MLVDAHIHLFDVASHNFSLSNDVLYFSSSASKEEFEFHAQYLGNKNIFLSAGIHPWNLHKLSLELLELWAQNGQIQAIGECGIDSYTSQLAETLSLQKELFVAQIAIAKDQNLPLVIHQRKGIHEILRFSHELSQLPAVIFHSWAGSPEELEDVLKRNINAFFSIGGSVFRKSKKMINSIKAIPLNRLLTETDAPFQSPFRESVNHPGTLPAIIGKCASIRGEKRVAIEKSIEQNFIHIVTR